jgi:protein-tyrosine phosphatase
MSEPRPDFKFRTGKYQGMTYEWVCDNNPQYIEWVKENQPNMLKEKVTTVTNVKEEIREFGKLKTNINFENEGPEWYCLPYLEKMIKDKNSPQ